MTQPEWYAVGSRVLKSSRDRWTMVIGFAAAGAGAGAGTALLLPSYFRSGGAFQAESSPQMPLGGALAGLASQLGGLQLGGQNNALLFGDLLRTDAVLGKIAAASYPWNGEPTPLAKIYGYDDEPAGRREYYSVRKLRGALDVDVNVRTGVVHFSVEARSPHLALAIAETTLAALNQANIALRQTRARAERTFTASRADFARQELTAVEDQLAAFYLRNRTFQASPTLVMEEARLRRTLDMQQQIYMQLRLQEEQAAVQEVRNTPAISIVDPPLLPVRRSWPKRRLAVVTGALIGLALAFVRLMLVP